MSTTIPKSSHNNAPVSDANSPGRGPKLTFRGPLRQFPEKLMCLTLFCARPGRLLSLVKKDAASSHLEWGMLLIGTE
ncbi:hypothetical protein JTE90_023037 [Oedothorax gibbosus]|uniref:Uncharacterized protein n=1 Tax=Oedothorax gibbosus TaxID=931172 RepID=A0AAV6UZW1_9ARAC|nr:hypothetical protein JTE90_023037 [Oedothorax gibbosus]